MGAFDWNKGGLFSSPLSCENHKDTTIIEFFMAKKPVILDILSDSIGFAIKIHKFI